MGFYGWVLDHPSNVAGADDAYFIRRWESCVKKARNENRTNQLIICETLHKRPPDSVLEKLNNEYTYVKREYTLSNEGNSLLYRWRMEGCVGPEPITFSGTEVHPLESNY